MLAIIHAGYSTTLQKTLLLNLFPSFLFAHVDSSVHRASGHHRHVRRARRIRIWQRPPVRLAMLVLTAPLWGPHSAPPPQRAPLLMPRGKRPLRFAKTAPFPARPAYPCVPWRHRVTLPTRLACRLRYHVPLVLSPPFPWQPRAPSAPRATLSTNPPRRRNPRVPAAPFRRPPGPLCARHVYRARSIRCPQDRRVCPVRPGHRARWVPRPPKRVL